MEITLESIRDQIQPYLSQKDKDTLVNALASFPRHIEYYIEKYRTELLQGDGWNSVEVLNFDSGERKLIKALLLSNSCDVDPENKRSLPMKLTFASMIKLANYKKILIAAGLDQKVIDSKLQSIREQRLTSLVYFPKGGELEDEYVALLDDIHTVPYASFVKKEQKQKLFTLSNVGFYLFVFKLSVHFCRLHEEVLRGDPV